MNRDEFVKQYNSIASRALAFSEKARSEGLLSVEDEIDREKADNRDIFEYGMSFVVDGVESTVIRDILSNIVAQEKDENARLLKTIQQNAVLNVYAGTHPIITLSLLNSLTDLTRKEDEVLKKYLEDLGILRAS